MDEEKHGSRLRDAFVTVPAVWAAMILAGLSGAWLQPSIGGAALSLAVCVGLLFAWAQWTGPGQRTALLVYLLAGLAYHVVVLTLAAGLAMGPLQFLAAGTVVGYQPGGGADTPLGYYLVPMALNLFGPILVMGALRAWLRGDLTT